MAFNWNEAQQKAIGHKRGTLLVGAAAGSGKTAVIVERIVSMLCDEQNPLRADRLLAVTFSRAAAAELRVRIRRRLEEKRRANPEIARQIALLGRAQISTVHAFCVALLREFYNLLDIPVDFALADDIAAADMHERAMEQALAALYADESAGFTRFSNLFGRARSDRDAALAVERIYDAFTLLRDPQGWKAEFLASMDGALPFTETAAGKTLLGYARGALASAQNQLVAAAELCARDADIAEKYLPAIRGDLALVGELEQAVAAADWDRCHTLARQRPQPLGGYRGDNKPRAARIKARRDRAKKIISDLSADTFSSFLDVAAADDVALKPAFEALFLAVDVFAEKLWDIKMRRKKLEFSDLERLAIKLLEPGSPEAAEIAGRFDAVLVDEYQDTNEVQSAIYELLAEDRDNLFAVGDVKQSIYRFRSADPSVFIDFRARCGEYGGETSPRYLSLNENYRSQKPVVDAVNAVFGALMTRDVGGADYDERERLNATRADLSQTAAGLEFDIVLTGEGELQKLGEPMHVAKAIKQMLDGGYEILERDGSRRACRAGDFCVLLRAAKTRAPLFASALKQLGVAVWSDADAGFFDSSEIEVLVALLGVVDNPARDVDLAASLLSPLFAFSPKELAELRTGDKQQPLWTQLQNSQNPKAAAFTSAIEHFRALRDSVGIDELVERVVDETQAEILLCAGDSAARRAGNIRSLIYYAADYAQSADPSLGGFLRQCRRAKDQGLSLASSFSPPKDAVAVITVHKAKGLEWPVVFLADTARMMNTRDSYDASVLFDSTVGLGAKINQESAGPGSPLVSRKTLRYRAVSRATRSKLAGEELRILYVALTRAMQKIVVTASLKDAAEFQKKLADTESKLAGGRADEFTVAAQTTFADWLLLVLYDPASPDAVALGLGEPYQNGSAILRCVEPPDIAPAQSERAKPKENPARAAQILEQINFRYARAALTKLPSKRSVSQLAKSGDAYVAPPAFANTSAALAARRGTAMHLFMQCADYKAAARSVEDELARLVTGGYLAPPDAALIDVPKLERFFKSDLIKRINAAEVLREYEFIDAVDAGALSGDFAAAGEPIMVQGIADCVVLEPGGAVLIDYKSDRVKTAAELKDRYATQLLLYKAAIEKRLEIPVTSCLIYSFELDEAVEINREETPKNV